MTIPSELLRTLILRGALLWVGGRLAAVVNLSMANIDGRELLPFWAVLITALLVLADLHRRKEILLLKNLGLAIGHVVIVATIPGVLLEFAWAAVR